MTMRLVALGLVLASVVLATLALVEVVWGEPSGEVVVHSGQPETVDWLLPGGPVWRAGVRGGQTVLSLTSGTTPRSWRLVTTDGVFVYSAPFSSFEAALRDEWPLALVAVGLATAAVVSFRRRSLAAALAAASIAVGAQVLLATGFALQSSAAATLAVVVPGAWLWTWSDRRSALRAGCGVALVCVAASWLVARAWMPSAFDAVESARQVAMGLGAAGIVFFLIDPKHWRERLSRLDGGQWTDLLAVAAVLAVTIVVAVVTELPAMLLAASGGLLVLSYPRLRHRIAETIDDVVLSGQRNRVRLQAVEDERGRIARDLHDAPLQEISAVIRDLERQGGSERQADALRVAAGHLRRVTTELRPPVLDDLGLGAAVSYLIGQARDGNDSMDVVGMVTPDDPLAPRPPQQVELAIFRIVQEAIDNAVHHSGGSTVTVTALVEPMHVVVNVRDNGSGITADAKRRAVSGGHVGLATMAERAALIGAQFDITECVPTGTDVGVAWRAPG